MSRFPRFSHRFAQMFQDFPTVFPTKKWPQHARSQGSQKKHAKPRPPDGRAGSGAGTSCAPGRPGARPIWEFLGGGHGIWRYHLHWLPSGYVKIAIENCHL